MMLFLRLSLSLLMLLSTSHLANAQVAQPVPQSRQQISLSFAPVVRQVAPAVVSIYAERTVRQRVSPFANDPFFDYFFGREMGGGLTRERVESAMGSGVIVDAAGLVVTNTHVIKDAQDIKVVLNDRREFGGKVIYTDDKADLAVVRLDLNGAKLPVLPLGDSDQLQVGDLVLAIGNPFGVGQTVTSGIVSATARTADGINGYGYFIQTDAAINPGNSGGALVDMSGALVGINTAIYSRDGGSLGIGFAVPVNMVQTVLAASKTGKRAVRPWLGVGVQTMTADLASALGLERPQGLIIKKLNEGGPLQQAGARLNDVIIAVNNYPVDSMEGLQFRTATRRMGETVPFTVLRNGQQFVLDVLMTPPPETPPREPVTIKGRNALSGATLVNLSPAVIEEIGYIGTLAEGVVVQQVEPRSAAAYTGVQAGDVILQINNYQINATSDVRPAIAAGERNGVMRLRVRRGDEVLTSVVRN